MPNLHGKLRFCSSLTRRTSTTTDACPATYDQHEAHFGQRLCFLPQVTVILESFLEEFSKPQYPAKGNEDNAHTLLLSSVEYEEQVEEQFLQSKWPMLDDDVENMEVDLYLLSKIVMAYISSCGQLDLDVEQLQEKEDGGQPDFAEDDEDKSNEDFVAGLSKVYDQDAYKCNGQKCSAQSLLFMHEIWSHTSLISKLKHLAMRIKLAGLTIGP